MRNSVGCLIINHPVATVELTERLLPFRHFHTSSADCNLALHCPAVSYHIERGSVYNGINLFRLYDEGFLLVLCHFKEGFSCQGHRSVFLSEIIRNAQITAACKVNNRAVCQVKHTVIPALDYIACHGIRTIRKLFTHRV